MGKGTTSGKASLAPTHPDDALRKSEEKYRLLIENAHDIIYTLTADGVFTYVSPAWITLLGHQMDQVIGKRMDEFLHPDDLSRCKAFLETVIKTEQRKSGIEYRVRHADGSWRWQISSGVPARDETGTVVGYQGIASDITERKQIEVQLEEAKSKVETYLNIVAEIILGLDTRGTITLLNDSGHRLLGYAKGELIGKNWFDTCLPGKARAEMKGVLTRLMSGEGEDVWIYENDVITKSGARLSLLWHNTLLRDQYGHISGILSSAENITEQKKFRDILAERENHFRLLFEQAPVPYQSLDVEGNILEVNSQWLAELGYARVEVIGKWFGDFIVPNSRETFRVNFPRFKAAGSITNVVLGMVRKDGSTITTAFNGKISHDERGFFKQTQCIFMNITEREKAAEERSQLLAMIDKSLNEIYVFDATTLKFSYANEGALQNLDYSLDELLDMTPMDLKPAFTDNSFRAAIRSLTAGDKPRLVFETVHRRKDGTIYPVEVHLQLMGDKSRPTFLALINDITDRKRSEGALRESEEKFRSVFEFSPIGKIMTAEDGTLHVNKAFAEMLGYSVLELETINWKKITYSDDIRKSDEFTESLVNKRGEPLRIEKRYIHKNGSIVWVQITSIFLKGINGAPGFFLTTAEDITDRKKAEEGIRKSESRLRRLVDILQHPSETIQDFLDYALDQALQLTGSKIGYIYHYSEESKEFVLNTWSKDVMPECTVAHPPSVYELEKTGFWGETVRQRKSIIANDFPAANPLKKGTPEGHVRLLKFMTVPIFRDQKIVGVVGLANKEADYNETDILETSLLMEAVWKVVERKKAEEKIRSLNAELEERVLRRTVELTAANKELEAFSYSVAHDLRAPLRSIEGFSEIFLDEYSSAIPEKGREYLERVKRNALRMGQLIDDILELARIGRSEIHPQKIDVSVLAVEVAEELATENPNRDVRVDIQPGMTVMADPQLLRIVLANLLGNAWKFTLKREHAHVSMGTAEDPVHGPSFFVRDDGIGFDDTYKDKLFVAFQRLHSEQDYPGMGIGLTNVQRVIRRHGGEVWAEGEIGKGATFYFSIPAF